MKKLSVNFLSIVMILFFPHPSVADETVSKVLNEPIKITNIDYEKKIVQIVQAASLSIRPDSVFIPEGMDACRLKPLSFEANSVTLSGSDCSDFAHLQAGSLLRYDEHPKPMEVATPPIPPVAKGSGETEKKDSLRIMVGAGYSFAKELEFDSLKLTTQGKTYSGSAKIETESAPQVFLELASEPMNSWGFEGGISFDFNREFKSSTVNVDNVSAVGTYTARNTISFTTIYANALYRWDKVYIPFGLNYSFANYRSDDSSDAQTTITSDLGGQIGVGVFIDEHFVLESVYRAIHARVTETASAYSADFGDAYLNGLQITLKYGF